MVWVAWFVVWIRPCQGLAHSHPTGDGGARLPGDFVTFVGRYLLRRAGTAFQGGNGRLEECWRFEEKTPDPPSIHIPLKLLCYNGLFLFRHLTVLSHFAVAQMNRNPWNSKNMSLTVQEM